MKHLIVYLVAICSVIVLVTSYNFFSRCSEFGGVVGVIKQCQCYGVEVSHPLDATESRPGFSSTMCVGLQLPTEKSTQNSTSQETPPILDPLCSQRIETGPCRAAFPAFEYSPSTNTCVEGTWGGCQGVRPFTTQESCESLCVK